MLMLSALAGVMLLGAAVGRADSLHLKNGRVLKGRVISKEASQVVFEVHAYGARVSRTFPLSQVDKIVRGDDGDEPSKQLESGSSKGKPAKPKPSGPKYMVIPIHGTIGLAVTDSVLKQAVNLVKIKKPDIVVLEIDSPGGFLEELTDMLETMKKLKKVRTVAYVKKEALSCAAILTLACKEIVVSPGASIGGAVIYRITPIGTPANINEKMESFYRAEFRNVAEAAGHNPLLVEGMMRTDMALYYTTNSDGFPDVSKSPGGKVLKPRGRILTLDAAQSLKCGLAAGTAKSVDEVNGSLAISRWHRMPDVCKSLFARHAHGLKTAKQQYKTAMEKADEHYYKAEMAWRRGSRRDCVDNLRKCEAQIGTAGALIKRYPRLGLPQEAIDHIRKRIKAIREQIEHR